MGKGDAWRKTNFRKYYSNWPENMGPQRPIYAPLRPIYAPLGCIRSDTSDFMTSHNGDRTHELVPMLLDGGGEILVEPTEMLDYPRDGHLTAQEAANKIREFAKKRPGFLIV